MDTAVALAIVDLHVGTGLRAPIWVIRMTKGSPTTFIRLSRINHRQRRAVGTNSINRRNTVIRRNYGLNGALKGPPVPLPIPVDLELAWRAESSFRIWSKQRDFLRTTLGRPRVGTVNNLDPGRAPAQSCHRRKRRPLRRCPNCAATPGLPARISGHSFARREVKEAVLPP